MDRPGSDGEVERRPPRQPGDHAALGGRLDPVLDVLDVDAVRRCAGRSRPAAAEATKWSIRDRHADGWRMLTILAWVHHEEVGP